VVATAALVFAEDALGSIFSPFTQADAQISRRFGGTGLGLALCKSLTDAMNGELSVESTLGQGSTFSVTPAGCYLPAGADVRLPAAGSLVIWNQQGHLQGRILL